MTVWLMNGDHYFLFLFMEKTMLTIVYRTCQARYLVLPLVIPSNFSSSAYLFGAFL